MSNIFRKKDSAAGREKAPSPCIDVCTINPETEMCMGCFRTVDEIAEWLQYSEEEKWEILAAIEKRKAYFEK